MHIVLRSSIFVAVFKKSTKLLLEKRKKKKEGYDSFAAELSFLHSVRNAVLLSP
ncbi:hypothetical protein NVIE_1168 [Nitrososphaera viennensis EN76]|uniref:Uncharacterized protein n=1 Tax=Nitrososphaera viennensis EN76 TaxID=926571 RepID=A0A060HFJ4_9ARCH|nr:hypothetical protein NVIE_1168 [Nitrososphaera viennensis EN76]